MDNQIFIKKKELMYLASYTQPPFPKYTSSLVNLLNRWARGTVAEVVGQMSDLVVECPHKDYEKWKEWYLKKYPDAIDKSVKLIMQKLLDVKESFDKIDESLVRQWVVDLVIDKSFWGLKIQEAILKKIEEESGIKCRLANKEEESKGIDGFVGKTPVQIKPTTYKSASNVKNEKLRAKIIYYSKQQDGNYVVDISEVNQLFKD